MKFTARSGCIFATSDLPGSYATMFGPDGHELRYRPDFSNHQGGHANTWAFDWPGALVDGSMFVFATADRSVVGVVRGSRVDTELHAGVVLRNGDGKPMGVAPAPSPARPRSRAVSVPRVLRPAAPPSSRTKAVSSPARPKVSIVTCSYNRPDLLREAVESLRRQSDPDWEHLIYDDTSTNPRINSTLEWAARDPRVSVWRGASNLDRPSVLWNFMLDRARGRYFATLDDDNEKLPDFVAAMSAELDADPTLDIVTCGMMVNNEREGKPGVPFYLNETTSPERLDRHSTCDGGAMLYRREVFERAGYYSEILRTNEDWDWFRRAHHVGRVKHLHECHSTYRNHDGNRMLRSKDLGCDGDEAVVRSKPLRATLGVRHSRPVPERLTQSQEDVCGGIQRGLDALDWVVESNEPDTVALIVSPFQINDEEIRHGIGRCKRVLSLHMEDPYALGPNLDRVRCMIGIAPEVWVCTNDASTVSAYQQLVGGRVLVCPSLSPDDTLPPPPKVERDIDVLLCGYAYPSRIRFVDELLPLLKGLNVLLVGDGWTRGKTMPTQDVESTRRLHARAKTVICLHRTGGDCSDGPVPPESVCRGFMEGFFGPRVFIDKARSKHPFEDGDVVWYDSPTDLAERLREYLTPSFVGASSMFPVEPQPRDNAAVRFAEKCATLYTYRARLARVLNCVRTERYLAEVP